VLRFEVSVEDLLRSRFALSPAMALCTLLRSLAGQNRPLPRAWAGRLLPTFERLRRESELNAALALQTPRSGADLGGRPGPDPGHTVGSGTARDRCRRDPPVCT
jgi:hypothetical protein